MHALISSVASAPVWNVARRVGACAVALSLHIGAAHAACVLENGPRHLVTSVIDGETLRLDDGSDVRLLGILSPHPLDFPSSPEASSPEASSPEAISPEAMAPMFATREALRALVAGQSIQLKFDGLRRDRGGRALAHVFVGEGSAAVSVAAKLLEGGHGRVVVTADNPNCVDELLTAEGLARSVRLGLWSRPPYAVREARQMARIALQQGTFQIVRGEIVTVRSIRDRVELTLAQVPGRSLVVRIGARDRAMLGRLGGDPKQRVGQKIEVRGWVIRHAGRTGLRRDLVIDIASAGLVTLLDGPHLPRPEPEGPEPTLRARPDTAPIPAGAGVFTRD